MISFVTLLWTPNSRSRQDASDYSEEWVEKLFRGVARNIKQPFKFICYVDRLRKFAEPIEQMLIYSVKPGYSDCIQPYELGVPMILMGLDTIVCGDLTGLVEYCLGTRLIALPRDPYQPTFACNGVALVPEGFSKVFTDHKGENDMDWMRAQEHVLIDELFPNEVISWKCHEITPDAKIVYFHGEQKPHQLRKHPFILEHWR